MMKKEHLIYVAKINAARLEINIDFSGKTVIPFASSGSSDVGETDKELRVSCSEKTNRKPAKRFANDVSADTFKKWVESLNL